jgi:alpha-soluble NSF attachment protein
VHVVYHLFSVFFHSGASKVDEAIECYQRAANLFKMAKKWSQAGQAFCEAANLHAKAGSRHDAATNYIDASNCFKKSEPNGLFFIHNIGTSTCTKN